LMLESKFLEEQNSSNLRLKEAHGAAADLHRGTLRRSKT
jgi:hypothetical protein